MPNKKTNIIKFPAAPTKLERQVEAILFAASEPLDIETIEKRVQTNTNIKKILENIKEIYKNRGINLVCIKNRWSFRTADDLSKLMSLQKSTQKKLSKATIETLAIIVYHQPVTRSEIEEIRGVSFASNTLEILLELDWVRPAGRKDVPGKPILYATTENFLNHFNIQKLSDLPTIDELGTAGLIDTSSIDKSIFGTGKFFKEQSIIENQNDIYGDIEELELSELLLELSSPEVFSSDIPFLKLLIPFARSPIILEIFPLPKRITIKIAIIIIPVQPIFPIGKFYTII